MTPELTATAERLRRIHAGASYLDVYDLEPTGHGLLSRDEQAFIEQTLDLYDPAPITPDALASLGFVQMEGSKGALLHPTGLKFWPEFVDRIGNARWELPDAYTIVCIPRQLRPQTIGQLRRLLSVLGEANA